MKAWTVYNKLDDYVTVVFAETRGKAHALAMITDACEGADWCSVVVRRAHVLDKEYRGRWEMDWYNAEDRIALVRDSNFSCSYEMDYIDCQCYECPAKEYCSRYESMLEEETI